MKYILQFDGSCEPNPGGHASYGYVIYNKLTPVVQDFGYIGYGEKQTNNVAEYHSLIYGLTSLMWLIKPQLENAGEIEVVIQGDSQLCINQLKGLFRVKKQHIRELFEHAMLRVNRIKEHVKSVEIKHIPRDKNEIPDKLSRLGLNLTPENIEMARKVIETNKVNVGIDYVSISHVRTTKLSNYVYRCSCGKPYCSHRIVAMYYLSDFDKMKDIINI